MPPGGQCLATSEACRVQALKWGTRAYSAQFHVEIEPDTVTNWSGIPEYMSALEKALGGDGPARMKADAEAHMKAMNDMAERFYINWLQSSAQV